MVKDGPPRVQLSRRPFYWGGDADERCRMNVARAVFLVAANAARRWPPGRPERAWFLEDVLEVLIHHREIPMADARRAGDPAICAAAVRAHLAGRAVIAWREVFVAQEQLVNLLLVRGVTEYNRTLSQEPLKIAALLDAIAEEIRSEGA